ncbi:hypothetical protein ACFYPT_38605 [Streptomyces sp. NPDC005529]|uniref:hypothetical protein n=1 Tax=unclassified Streptomyces TaxID=2593676 RepID=UPI0033B579FD
MISPTAELIGTLKVFTDGEWFWYTDLPHYVEKYHVSLDAHFVDHARGRDWIPPELSEADLVRIAGAFFPDDASESAVADGKP